jgi:hypothetical protein
MVQFELVCRFLFGSLQKYFLIAKGIDFVRVAMKYDLPSLKNDKLKAKTLESML